MFLPDGQRGPDAFFKKLLIHLDSLRRQDADVDFGFGIEKTDAEESLAVVLHLDEFAVGGGWVSRRISV